MINAIRSIYKIPVIDIDVATHGKRTKYSELQVKQALALYKEVKCYGEVEKQLGVSRNTVRLWVKKFLRCTIHKVDKRNVPKTYRVKPRVRMNTLVELVKTKPMNSVELADKLNVTTATVCNDILSLITEGRINDVSVNHNVRLVVAA